MQRFLLLALLIFSLNQASKAQSLSKDTLVNDTTVYDDRTLSEGHDLQLPQPILGWEQQYKVINKEFAGSKILQSNKSYIKVEVTSLVEKDGSVSSCTIKGTGPEAVKKELIRILKLTAKYDPGTRDGQPARCRIYQPFEFSYN